MSKNLGNGVLHEDIGQKMTKLENRWRAAAILDSILNYGVCPPVPQWYSLVSENTTPNDSKTLKISRWSFHSRLGQFWPYFLQTINRVDVIRGCSTDVNLRVVGV